MKNKTLFVVSLLTPGGLVLCATAYGQDDQGNGDSRRLGPYKFVTTISIPGGLTGFDISWVDSEHARYYLAARGNPPFNIPVIDTEKDVLLYQIPLTNRANGVVVIHRTGDDGDDSGAGTLVAGTTPNTGESSKVFFIDLAHPFAPPVTVSTGGHIVCVRPCRADELAYDPQDHIILVANDRDEDRFVTLISTEGKPHVIGKIFYDGSTPGNPTSNGGLEQPVWDKQTRRFYLAIPSTVANNGNGEVDEIDPNANARSGGSDFGKGKITRTFPSSTACTGPAGLVLIPKQRLMTSCGDVLDVKTGAVKHVAGVSGDEIWFNPGDDRVYFGNTPAFVVDAETYQQIVGAGPNGPPIPAGPTHSIAADSENNRIFIPVTGEGVKVFTDDVDHDNER